MRFVFDRLKQGRLKYSGGDGLTLDLSAAHPVEGADPKVCPGYHKSNTAPQLLQLLQMNDVITP
jgi:hypothetical protein